MIYDREFTVPESAERHFVVENRNMQFTFAEEFVESWPGQYSGHATRSVAANEKSHTRTGESSGARRRNDNADEYSPLAQTNGQRSKSNGFDGENTDTAKVLDIDYKTNCTIYA